MALNTDPSVEIKKQEEVLKHTKTLRDRWDADYAMARLEEFVYKIPTKEGSWDLAIPNRAKTEGNKIVDLLSYAKRKLWIPITDETKKTRETITATERLAIGILNLADSLVDGIPEEPKIQAQLSFYRTHRGATAMRVYLYVDDDGNLIPDITIWDILNSYWMTRKRRISWCDYISYMTEAEVKSEYDGWNGSVNETTGFVELHNVYECSEGKQAQEGVIIGKEYVKEPADLGLDYIPVRIKMGRSTPLVHSSESKDTLKDIGESYLANNRTVYPLEARLLSYKVTRAGQLAKAPKFIKYDSTGGGLPPDMSTDPNEKGSVIFLDVSKKHELVADNTMPRGTEISEAYADVAGMAERGGLARVAYGAIDQQIPAQGIDILTHSTQDVIKPFKQGIEEDFTWLAMEVCRQYKNGDFDETTFSGFDKSNNPFEAKISKEKVELKQFACELVPDLLRDKAANIGMAKEAVASRLLPRKMAIELAQVCEDSDLAMEMMASERISEMTELDAWEAVAHLAKDGQLLKAQTLQNKLMQMSQPPQGQSQPGMPTGPGSQSPGLQVAGMRPSMNAKTAMSSVPPSIQNAARNRQMGV
jgi:hypothetical protein